MIRSKSEPTRRSRSTHVSHCGTLLLNNHSAQLSINGQVVQRACSLLLDLLALAAQQFNEGLHTIFFDELRMDCQTNPPLLPSRGKRSSACRAPEWLSSPPLFATVLITSRVQRHRTVVFALVKFPLAISQSPYGLFFCDFQRLCQINSILPRLISTLQGCFTTAKSS